MRNRGIALALWLGLVALIVASAWLTLVGCGICLPGGRVVLNFCPVAASAPPSLLADAKGREQGLRQELASLERALATAPACPVPEPVVEPPPPPPEPVPEPPPAPPPPPPEPPPQPPQQQAHEPPPPPPPRPPQPEPAPEPVPQPEPEPEQAAAPPQPPLPPCPQRRPTEVILVVDASTSMKFNYDLDPAEEESLGPLDALAGGLGALAGNNPLLGVLGAIANQGLAQRRYQDLVNQPGIDRIDVAKGALRDLVQAAPNDVGFSLLSFNQCGPPQMHGQFPPGAKAPLLRSIQGIELDFEHGPGRRAGCPAGLCQRRARRREPGQRRPPFRRCRHLQRGSLPGGGGPRARVPAHADQRGGGRRTAWCPALRGGRHRRCLRSTRQCRSARKCPAPRCRTGSAGALPMTTEPAPQASPPPTPVVVRRSRAWIPVAIACLVAGLLLLFLLVAGGAALPERRAGAGRRDCAGGAPGGRQPGARGTDPHPALDAGGQCLPGRGRAHAAQPAGCAGANSGTGRSAPAPVAARAGAGARNTRRGPTLEPRRAARHFRMRSGGATR